MQLIAVCLLSKSYLKWVRYVCPLNIFILIGYAFLIGKAEAMRKQAQALQGTAGSEAAALTIARDYVNAFGNVAGTGHVLMLPGNGGPGDVTSMIANAMSIYKTVTSSYDKWVLSEPEDLPIFVWNCLIASSSSLLG